MDSSPPSIFEVSSSSEEDNFYNAVDEQESKFKRFYKKNNGKIKQRLWLGIFETQLDREGRDAFNKLLGLNLIRWAVGQAEEGPHPRKQFIRVAFMTKKQYTPKRIATLLRRQTTNVKPGAGIKGAIILATDITRRLPGTDTLEYGNPPPVTPPADSDDDDDEEDDVKSRDAILEEALKFDNPFAAMNYIKQKDRLWYISSQKQIRHFIEGEIVDRSNRAMYDRHQFNTPTLDLTEPAHRNRAVVLIGPTGLGKTQWALAHFKNPVHIRDKNDYARITDKTDGLVLDDLDQMHWQPLTLLKLVECETNVTMNIKYGSKVIRAGMPRFIIANSWELFWPQNFKPESIDAVERRVVSYVIKAKLYGAPPEGPTLNRVAQFNFLFVANNISAIAELNKTKRAAQLRELEAADNRRKFQHLGLRTYLSSTGGGEAAPDDGTGAPTRPLQADSSDAGIQNSEAVSPAELGHGMALLADD